MTVSHFRLNWRDYYKLINQCFTVIRSLSQFKIICVLKMFYKICVLAPIPNKIAEGKLVYLFVLLFIVQETHDNENTKL